MELLLLNSSRAVHVEGFAFERAHAHARTQERVCGRRNARIGMTVAMEASEVGEQMSVGNGACICVRARMGVRA
eukprot:260976-Pleurochrysis_carterae.AAC.1